MQSLLEWVEFRNPARARDDIARLGDGIPEGIVARIQAILASLPDPDEALHFLERLRHDSPAVFDRLITSPAALQCSLAIFSYSNFLSEAALQRPEWLLETAQSPDFQRELSAEEYADRLGAFQDQQDPATPPAVLLARFRRREMLRIVLRDVLSNVPLSEITSEISSLADAILDSAYREIRAHLAQRYGEPTCLGANGRLHTCAFAVIALGKLGGEELNYSSDIDLMFVYEANGETAGPESITNKEFLKKVANQYTDLLSTYTTDGLCYRVDLRLRPEGSLGEVCISLEGAQRYYAERARDWEKQMLIKARVCAGDRALGRELLEFVEPLTYASSLDFHAVEAVSEARERISEKLAARRNPRSGLDIKLAPGGIRDIEFLVQCLQRLHGGREPWVRQGGTLLALSRLHDKNLLRESEYGRLAAAYQFLRQIEHRLQFYEDRQTHTLPTNWEEIELLARKMPLEAGEPLTAASLEVRLEEHLSGVRDMYRQVIESSKPGMAMAPGEFRPPSRLAEERAPELAASLAQAKIGRGRERFDHFLEKVFANPGALERLRNDATLVDTLVDIFEYSPYFGDQLLRSPEMLDELAPATPLHRERIADAFTLRTAFHREMFRIQSASILGRASIFDTLARTSDLADRTIAAAYQIALHDAPHPNGNNYRPANQMMVIALGRLGMREFDLASDADLVFVLPDEDASEQVFWTGVAERIINTISAYTGAGVVFSVDTRLRPDGREGALVQTEERVKEYFAKRADAWEGIAYMKARAVAGDIERATAFLHRLQEVDWRRYGQSRRSRKDLAQMRARLEKEQGNRNPLKAGTGGYYDIDFALMYLRLRGAGIFYKVLNTPERIDVIEQMGLLDAEDAAFLRDAAVFYRAIDHALRIASGYAGGRLPSSPAQSELIADLVRRWTPPHLHDKPLGVKLQEIRQQTREFFNRIFAG